MSERNPDSEPATDVRRTLEHGKFWIQSPESFDQLLRVADDLMGTSHRGASWLSDPGVFAEVRRRYKARQSEPARARG